MAAKKIEIPANSRKRKRIIPTRAAGTPAFENPADELFAAAFANRLKNNSTQENNATLPYPSIVESTLDNPTLIKTSAGTQKVLASVSPNKNFTKVSNSILKQALPEGLFRGQSKHTYDVLYLHTRGAINPIRQIQLTKLELVRLTGLEIKTIQRHLSFLKTSGLILVDPKIGDHKGAIYEVNIPEEMTLPYPTLTHPSIVESSVGETSAVSTPDPSINSTTVRYGLGQKNIGEKPSSKTSLKTNTENDDEPFGAMIGVLRKVSEKVSGKTPQKSDREKWKEFAELIGMELEMAAARTNSISSVPAFLTEHLRRRLVGKKDSPKSKGRKSLKVSKIRATEVEPFVAEPLTEESREVVLKTFKEYAEKGQRDYVLSFEETYTKEDWSFLLGHLK